MGYVYLINELGTNNYKIGVTKGKDVTKRMKHMETGNSHELFITRTFLTDKPYKLEGFLHRHYSGHHNAKEWFILSDEQALDFINVCNKYNDIMNVLLVNPFY